MQKVFVAATSLTSLILCNLLQRQNVVAETKIFTKILQNTRSDLSNDKSPQFVAATSRPTRAQGVTCGSDVLLQLVA